MSKNRFFSYFCSVKVGHLLNVFEEVFIKLIICIQVAAFSKGEYPRLILIVLHIQVIGAPLYRLPGIYIYIYIYYFHFFRTSMQ